MIFFFFSSRRRHTRLQGDWSSDVCSSDLLLVIVATGYLLEAARLVWLEARPDVWAYRWWSPAGAALAEGLRSGGMSAVAGWALGTCMWRRRWAGWLCLCCCCSFCRPQTICPSAAPSLFFA